MAKARSKQSSLSLPSEALYVQRSPAKVTWQVKFNDSVIDQFDRMWQAEKYASDLAKTFRFSYAGVYRGR